MDEAAFFKEVTLKICGSLDINKALKDAFYTLQKRIPMHGVLLGVYHSKSSMFETIAGFIPGKADPRCMIYMPPSVTRELNKDDTDFTRKSFVKSIERWGEYKSAYPIANKLGLNDCSALQMRLIVEGRLIGRMALINVNGVPFNNEHEQLLQSLNEPFSIALSNYLRYREVTQLKDMLAEDNRFLKTQLGNFKEDGIIGAELGLMEVMKKVERVAPSNCPVLILGETGTGKELVAAAIHKNSPRSRMPFIKVNCGAIPDTLIDSELFGHEKGAFTGASTQTRGYFERAHQGTIFLDEIGELPLSAQVRLLRVLQDNRIERVGGSSSLQLDIRVVAATNRDIAGMMKEQKFREDLYFRLNVFPIRVPPLRDRLEDIPYLTNFFIKRKCLDMGLMTPALSPGEIERLKTYSWPGNVRELENLVERALILRDSENTLSFKALLETNVYSIDQKRAPSPEEPLNLDEITSRHIKRVLRISDGKIHGPTGAAALLGINSSTLRARMSKLNIPFGRKTNKNYN
ncbi:MAG: sigma 54-interacting transcriptional regulator [Pseudomonadota bacterium]